MSNNWVEISINTTTIVSELLSEFLLQEGAKGTVLGEWDPEKVSEYTTLRAYFPEDFKNTSELLEKISDKFDFYFYSGLNLGAKEISINLVKEEDWANSWKQYFHVLHIGKNIVIKPLWEDYQAKDKELVINFDPGMAFGTGGHPSTQLCMEAIEDLTPTITDKDNYHVLDLGTGSGILAIQLALSGFKNVTAIDNDIVAVKASEANFKLNNLEINLSHSELKDCKQQYDLIMGNLLAEIIELLAEGIAEKLVSGGTFIGSGIINKKEADVLKALTSQGLILKETKYQGDWVLVNFTKP